MGGLLAPHARQAAPRNYHKENLQKMHEREQQIQMQRESDVNKRDDQWKMRRFQGVEGKVAQSIKNGSAPSVSNETPNRQVTKADQMKLRYQQQNRPQGAQ